MLVIPDGALARAIDYPLDPPLRDLLLLRRDQLGGDLTGVRLILVLPGDSPRWVEEALGWSIFSNPATGTWHGDPDHTPGFDLIEDLGCAYELIFERTTGHTDVVLVQKDVGVHRDFLAFCEEYAPQHA